jgi:poly-beta-1,6-N-acetyl-D-glucosamine synthase
MNDIFIFFRNLIYIFVGLMWVKYYLFLLISPFYPIRELLRNVKHKKQLEAADKLDDFNPKVSIIIPAWNEEVGIIKTVKSVISNDYENIEVIIVNDGSTDNSDKIIKQFIKYLKINKIPGHDKIEYVYQENGGKGRALNTGIEHSTGDIILTMDADSAIDSNGIYNLVQYYLDPKIMAVVGNVKVAQNNTIVGLLQQLEYYFGFYFKRAYSMLGAEYIFGGACASFRRTVFEQLGLFDISNKTEDIEMSMRTRFAGMECAYAENVVAYTEGASTAFGLINQRVRWKKGRFDTFWKYRSMFFSTSDNHNTYLSFFILPLAMISELQLLIEPLAIAILITYSIIASDYLSLSLGIIFIFQTYLVACVFNNEKVRLGRLLSFVYTWPLFYVLVWIEFLSLCKSIVMTLRGEEIEWQRWDRTGIGSEINL